MEYLRRVLEQQGDSCPRDGTKPLYLKFALDGTTMTSGRHIQEEIGAFQYLYDGQKLADVKSPEEAHMWIIYIGAETEEILRYDRSCNCTDQYLISYSGRSWRAVLR